MMSGVTLAGTCREKRPPCSPSLEKSSKATPWLEPAEARPDILGESFSERTEPLLLLLFIECLEPLRDLFQTSFHAAAPAAFCLLGVAGSEPFSEMPEALDNLERDPDRMTGKSQSPDSMDVWCERELCERTVDKALPS
jgi:hypothetical protein